MHAQVQENRDLRGAPDKPVIKKRSEYLREAKEMQRCAGGVEERKETNSFEKVPLRTVRPLL